MTKEGTQPRNDTFLHHPITRRAAIGVIGAGMLTTLANPTAAYTEFQSPTAEVEDEPEVLEPGDLIFSVPGKRRKAFLTVDDCNNKYVVKQWLRLGRDKNVSFTFFPTGLSVERDPDLFIQAIEEGHELGIHSYSHPDLAPLPLDRVRRQIGKNLIAIRDEVSPEERINLLRLPYGSGTNDRQVRRAARDFNYVIVQWNNSSVDTAQFENTEDAVRKIVRNLDDIKAGDIVLFHANYPHSPIAAREVLDRMQSNGLTSAKLSANLNLAPSVGEPPIF